MLYMPICSDLLALCMCSIAQFVESGPPRLLRCGNFGTMLPTVVYVTVCNPVLTDPQYDKAASPVWADGRLDQPCCLTQPVSCAAAFSD